MKTVTWVQPEDVLRHELAQSAQEGKDVAAIRSAWVAAGGNPDPPVGGVSGDPTDERLRSVANALLDELAGMAEVGADAEPSDWPAIRESLAAPDDPASAPDVDPSRYLGGWIGRAVACVLGKPVEKVPRAGIEAILRSTGRWPLQRYFTARGLDPEVAGRWPWNRASAPTSLEENLHGTPEDDDINYTILALLILEQCGPDFDAGDVATRWLLDLPAGRTFTAERAAYRNLLQGLEPPASARVRNPYREWIGAQIRTDCYGWVNPGRPLQAAEWAFRDASVSHTRNGLYGAMFVAAMASTALVADTVEEVLDAGQSVLPPSSRMAAAVSLGRELAATGTPPERAYPALEREFANLHWVHSLNNAALATYALAASRGDFDRAICLTVMGGWDTDSNGATVGAVTGALHGAGAIDPYWSDPLQGRVSSSIPGADGLTFAELAERTAALAERWRPR